MAARIVESASVVELFSRPRHPYTVGLLRSLPRLDVVDERWCNSGTAADPDAVAERVQLSSALPDRGATGRDVRPRIRRCCRSALSI